MSRENLEENAEKFKIWIKLADDYNLVEFDKKRRKIFETFWSKDK